MKEEIALIDIDGVIAELLPAINSLRSLDNLPDIPGALTWSHAERSPEEQEYVDNFYKDPAMYALAVPIVGAIDAMRKLAKKYYVVLITGRGAVVGEDNLEHMRSVTVEWMQQHGVVYDALMLVAYKDKGSFAKTTFGDAIAFAVDDSPGSLESYINAGIKTYCIDYPYNSESGGIRVNSLLAVAELEVNTESWHHFV